MFIPVRRRVLGVAAAEAVLLWCGSRKKLSLGKRVLPMRGRLHHTKAVRRREARGQLCHTVRTPLFPAFCRGRHSVGRRGRGHAQLRGTRRAHRGAWQDARDVARGTAVWLASQAARAVRAKQTMRHSAEPPPRLSGHPRRGRRASMSTIARALCKLEGRIEGDGHNHWAHKRATWW